ncbi:amidohydrolase family protein [Kitasatospora sp. NPDC087314]|uniref:amidohydrolase family protein n=1 Tax=Kitasatospora sp. NPDC087314 TaxID=3364068 RepID=UPI0037F41E61
MPSPSPTPSVPPVMTPPHLAPACRGRAAGPHPNRRHRRSAAARRTGSTRQGVLSSLRRHGTSPAARPGRRLPLRPCGGPPSRASAPRTPPPRRPGRRPAGLRAMTVNAALAAGEEQSAGRIAVGHRADLTVLAADPITTPAAELPDVPVLLTLLGGRPTHRADAL